MDQVLQSRQSALAETTETAEAKGKTGKLDMEVDMGYGFDSLPCGNLPYVRCDLWCSTLWALPFALTFVCGCSTHRAAPHEHTAHEPS